MRSRKRRVLLVLIPLLLILIVPGFDSRLLVRHYEIEMGKLEENIRIALVTDLHSCYYGENQKELIEAVDGQNPDLLVFCGDIFDDELDDGNTETFLRDISQKYPCFYVTGNHEFWSEGTDFSEKMAIVEKYGIKRLSGELETMEINGERINICGIDDPSEAYADYTDKSVGESFSGQLDRVEELALAADGKVNILLSHRPEYFEEYIRYDFDLVLCGHAHGGQWRIPYILNGLYAPNQGLFPKYAGGEYREGDTVMIVSRGLARESTVVPRFYNRPELVIIDCA